MSVATEITRIQGAKADLKTAIEAKGVTVPSATLIDGYAALVAEIPSGGGDDSMEHYLNNTLTSYTVPASVTSLHNYCFSHLTNLKSINLNNVTSIGERAFESCDLSGQDLVINEDVTIGDYAFYQSGLKKVDFKGDATLSTYVFNYCNDLEKIIFEGNFTFNGSNTWLQDCYKIKSAGGLNSGCNIEIDTSGSLPSRLFSSYGLNSIELDNTTSLNNYSIDGCFGLKKLTLPSTLTAINGNNFSYFYSLKELEFKSVNPPTWQNYKNNSSMPLMDIIVPAASLQSYKTAFPEFSDIIFADNDKPSHQYSEARYWSNNTITTTTSQDTTLTSNTFISTMRRAVYVGKNVTEIQQNFKTSSWHCVIPDDNSIETIGNNALKYTHADLNLPNIVSIGQNAFEYSTFENISLGNNLTTIGNQAFQNVTSNGDFVVPDSVTNMGYSVFQYAKIKKVTLGSGIAMQNSGYSIIGTRYLNTPLMEVVVRFPIIYQGNFQGANTLDIVLTENVTTIKYYSISSPHSLTCLSTTPPTMEYNGITNLNDAKIYVPAESVEAYKAATNWSNYASNIEAIPSE